MNVPSGSTGSGGGVGGVSVVGAVGFVGGAAIGFNPVESPIGSGGSSV